jgi:PST family polysaccharide transporter
MLFGAKNREGSELAKNVLWLYALQGMNYLIPMLLLPYLVRVLGVSQYGLVAFSQSIAQYFIIATDYGFNYSATRQIALHRHDPGEVSRIFYGVMAIKMALVVAGAAIMGSAVIFVPRLRADSGIYLAAYVAVIGSALFPVWLFQGMERMQFISIITGISKLASAASVVLLVHSRQDAFLATLLQSFGWVIAGLIGVTFGIRKFSLRPVLPDRKSIVAMLHDGRHLFVSTAAITLYTNTNVFLVGAIAGNTEAGYFSLADRFIRAVTGLAFPVIQATYPRVVRMMADSRDHALAFIRKLIVRVAIIAFAVGVAILALARPIAHVTFGRDALAVVPVIRLAALFPLVATLSAMLGMLVLIPFGFEKIQSQMLMGAGVLNVLVASLLIRSQGAIGGVLSMILIETLLVAGSTLVLMKNGVFNPRHSNKTTASGL